MQQPRCPRYHSLDFWRGVACLMVVAFHSVLYVSGPALEDRLARGGGSAAEWVVSVASRGWAGVPLFFVISGYCISATADSARRKNSPVRLYFWRRFRRIFPPYWVFLLLAAAAVGLFEWRLWPGLFSDSTAKVPPPWWLAPPNWLGQVTLTETWRYHLAGPPPMFFMFHAWTLCYEEQFYAVVGVLLLVAPRRFFAGILAVTAAVLAATVAARKVAALAWIRGASEGFFFNGNWLYFAAGVGVYYAVNYASPAWRRAYAVLLAVAFAAPFRHPAAALALDVSVEGSMAAAFGFALALLLLHPLDRRLSGSPFAAPVSWCGLMCYSLYLVHWPVCKGLSHALYAAGVDTPRLTVLVTMPACLAASIAAAWPFHVLVERRFLNPPSAAVSPSAPVAAPA